MLIWLKCSMKNWSNTINFCTNPKILYYTYLDLEFISCKASFRITHRHFRTQKKVTAKADSGYYFSREEKCTYIGYRVHLFACDVS